MIYFDEFFEFTIEDWYKCGMPVNCKCNITYSPNKNKNMQSTFQQLKKLNKLRFPKFGKYKDIKECDPIYLTNAISGEAGELSNKVKHLEDRLPVTATEIADEVGDILTYLDLFCQRMGFDLEECLITKFNKVSDRERWPELKIQYNMDSEISVKYKRLSDELYSLKIEYEKLKFYNEKLSKNFTMGVDWGTNYYCSKKELEESNFKLKKAAEEIAGYRAANENLKKEIDFVSAKSKSIDVEKQQLRKDIEYYQKNYIYMADHNHVVSELNSRIKELTLQKESLSNTISKLNGSQTIQEVEKLKEEIKKLNDNIHQKEFTVSFLKQSSKRHEETISKIKDAIGIYENPFTSFIAFNPFKRFL